MVINSSQLFLQGRPTRYSKELGWTEDHKMLLILPQSDSILRRDERGGHVRHTGRACLNKDVQAGGQAFHIELVQQPVRARLQDVQPSPGGVGHEPALERGRMERRHCLYELPSLQSSELEALQEVWGIFQSNHVEHAHTFCHPQSWSGSAGPCRLEWKDTSNCSAVSFRLGGCRRFRLALSLLTVTLEASATTAAAALAAQCSLLDVSCLLRFVLGLCSLLAALMSKANLRPLLEADALLLTLSYSSMPALDG